MDDITKFGNHDDVERSKVHYSVHSKGLFNDDTSNKYGHLSCCNDSPAESKSRLNKMWTLLISSYSKRNIMVNIFLSFCLITSLSSSLIVLLYCLLGFIWSLFTSAEGFLIFLVFSTPPLFYSLCNAYYNYKFIVGNEKNAKKYAFFSSLMLWFCIFLTYNLAFSPEYNEDGTRIKDIDCVFGAFLISLIFNLFALLAINLFLKIKKYGVSAKSIFDNTCDKSSKFEKVCHIFLATLWLIPIVFALYSDFAH